MNKIKHNLSFRNYYVISFVFLIFALILIFTRVVFRDETWLYGISEGYLREGLFIDLAGMRDNNYEVNFSGIPFFSLLVVWIKIVGNNIILLRLLSVILGILFIYLILNIFKAYNRIKVLLVVTVIFTNYFFLYAFTQLRYEPLSLTLVMGGLFILVKRPIGNLSLNYVLAFVILVISIFSHLQSIFVAAPLLLYSLILLVKEKKWPTIFYVCVCSIMIIGFFFLYFYVHSEYFWKWYDLRFGENANMAGHAGGMINAVQRYLGKHEYYKILAALYFFSFNLIILINANKNNFIKKDYKYYYFYLAGWGALLGWVLTTNIINDYHTVWMVFILINLIYINFRNKKSLLFLAMPILVSLIGIFYTISTAYKNELKLYRNDIIELQEIIDERDVGVITKNRRIMLDLNFDRNIFDIERRSNHSNILEIIEKKQTKKQDSTIIKGQIMNWKIYRNIKN